jgi:hypothetical protein
MYHRIWLLSPWIVEMAALKESSRIGKSGCLGIGVCAPSGNRRAGSAHVGLFLLLDQDQNIWRWLLCGHNCGRHLCELSRTLSAWLTSGRGMCGMTTYRKFTICLLKDLRCHPREFAGAYYMSFARNSYANPSLQHWILLFRSIFAGIRLCVPRSHKSLVFDQLDPQ